jgi:hypothetical protein
LTELHIPYIGSVHAEDAGYCTEREEDDGYDGEGVDGLFLAVFGVGVFVFVLSDITLVTDRSTSRGRKEKERNEDGGVIHISVNIPHMERILEKLCIAVQSRRDSLRLIDRGSHLV